MELRNHPTFGLKKESDKEGDISQIHENGMWESDDGDDDDGDVDEDDEDADDGNGDDDEYNDDDEDDIPKEKDKKSGGGKHIAHYGERHNKCLY